jgi:hypothetical protein
MKEVTRVWEGSGFLPRLLESKGLNVVVVMGKRGFQ